jgi:putative spermidine/putrescine transport system ATP-binding protein
MTQLGTPLSTQRDHATDSGIELMVRLDRVTKRFDDHTAVDRVSFDVAKGAFLTILGPSGSGKTTVLRMIAGFIPADEGSVAINGRSVDQDPPYARSIGMVFQRLALFPHLTAAENVAYPLKRRGWPKAEIDDRVARFLDLVRLPGLGNRRIQHLSGGQQQRVAIARALVFEPDLLLLDEPLAALDRKLRENMQLEFRRIQQELRVTTINVTHDQREALVMSDQVLVMDHGRVHQHAPPTQTYHQPSDRFVAGFIGVTNFLNAEIISIESDGRASVKIGEHRFEGRTADPSLRPGSPVVAAIRAEKVSIGEPEVTDGLPAVIRETVFEGDRLVYRLHVHAWPDRPLLAFDYGSVSTLRSIGETVQVTWRGKDLMIFPP